MLAPSDQWKKKGNKRQSFSHSSKIEKENVPTEVDALFFCTRTILHPALGALYPALGAGSRILFFRRRCEPIDLSGQLALQIRRLILVNDSLFSQLIDHGSDFG